MCRLPVFRRIAEICRDPRALQILPHFPVPPSQIGLFNVRDNDAEDIRVRFIQGAGLRRVLESCRSVRHSKEHLMTDDIQPHGVERSLPFTLL